MFVDEAAQMSLANALAVACCLCASLSMVGATVRAETPARPAQEARVPLEHLPALRGDYFALRSQATGRDYHVYVRLPEGYDADPDRRWPVVYLLDGDSLFPLLAPTHLFLHYDEQLPEAIIVGLAYGGFDPAVNLRHVDFSAPGPDTPEGEGGAPAPKRSSKTSVKAEAKSVARLAASSCAPGSHATCERRTPADTRSDGTRPAGTAFEACSQLTTTAGGTPRRAAARPMT